VRPRQPSCSPETSTQRCFRATGRRCSQEAPFDLLFADGDRSKYHEELLGLLAPGGTLLLDDLTPGYEGRDPVRELWLDHPRLVAAELQISPREAVIVGTLQPR